MLRRIAMLALPARQDRASGCETEIAEDEKEIPD